MSRNVSEKETARGKAKAPKPKPKRRRARKGGEAGATVPRRAERAMPDTAMSAERTAAWKNNRALEARDLAHALHRIALKAGRDYFRRFGWRDWLCRPPCPHAGEDTCPRLAGNPCRIDAIAAREREGAPRAPDAG